MIKGKRKTMYMHTLEGKPARFSEDYGGFVYFCGGRSVGLLVPTLAQIRREQKIALRVAAESNQGIWANPKLYGYVRVEVPA